MAARHQHQEEEDRMRKEASDGRLAKEYAQNMSNWARMVHTHNENMQKFMEVRSVIQPYVFTLVSI